MCYSRVNFFKKEAGAKVMLRDFNLLVSTTRGNEADVCSEIWYLLSEIGDSSIKVDKTGVSGLIVAKSSFSPFDESVKI